MRKVIAFTLILISGCAHNPRLPYPEPCTPLVMNFLNGPEVVMLCANSGPKAFSGSNGETFLCYRGPDIEPLLEACTR